MIQDAKFFEQLDRFVPPVLIVSTNVGRGMYTLGEAFNQRLPADWVVYHHPIEDFLPQAAVGEDVRRYRFIITHVPVLLNLIYRVPLFYWRKAWRERSLNQTDLSLLHQKIETLGIRTVVCISHRPAFWTTLLKERAKLPTFVWGLLGEYGRSLGWKYVGWEHIDGYFSPLPKASLRLPIPDRAQFIDIELPARLEYYDVAKMPGDPDKILLIGGFWGTGPLRQVIYELADAVPHGRVYLICGENEQLRQELAAAPGHHRNVEALGVVESIVPWLQSCASIVTKPGISTILEAHAARRQLFLLEGAPVAETHNAEYAKSHWGAVAYSIEAFRAWHRAQSGTGRVAPTAPAVGEPAAR